MSTGCRTPSCIDISCDDVATFLNPSTDAGYMSIDDHDDLLRSTVDRQLTGQLTGEDRLTENEIQACYLQLQHLVPTIPVGCKLSRVQLLQHVIDYILDLEEMTLTSHVPSTSSPVTSASMTSSLHDTAVAKELIFEYDLPQNQVINENNKFMRDWMENIKVATILSSNQC